MTGLRAVMPASGGGQVSASAGREGQCVGELGLATRRGRVQDEGLAHLVVGEDADKDLAAAHRHVIRDLAAGLWLQPHVALAGVHALVKPSLYLTDTDTEGADQHGDGGVGDIVRYPDHAHYQRVVTDVHDTDVDTANVEPVLGHVVEAILLAEADKYLIAGQADPLHLAQLCVKLSLQLVNDLRHTDITQLGIVLCTEHDGVGLHRVEPNDPGPGAGEARPYGTRGGGAAFRNTGTWHHGRISIVWWSINVSRVGVECIGRRRRVL